ncbi:hypothetical protein EVJ58_g5403 [Rhodofomes roseus]|uniref:Uncharacterized protein n=1 Tax=Rhodofomes roseus TaxID=34475 RepID=A0A4Y9YDB7_9APHY|nr:hypothetical protein EVJ58_g5403 [Rhodofomes roseus]
MSPPSNSGSSEDDGLYFVPVEGTYIVLQLDPVNTVEPLGNSLLTAAAQALQPKKYIAHVFEIMELPIPKRPDHMCLVALVGQGLCRQDDDACIDTSIIAIATVRVPTKLYYDLTNAVSIISREIWPMKVYLDDDHTKRDIRLEAQTQGVAQPSSGQAANDLPRVHTAPNSVVCEAGRLGDPAPRADGLQTDISKPGVDALDSEPQMANGGADVHHGDLSTNNSRSVPAAPHTMIVDSKEGPADKTPCLPTHLEPSQTDRAALPPDASAGVYITEDAHGGVEIVDKPLSSSDSQRQGQHVGDDGRSGSATPSMIESIADRPRSASLAPSDLLDRVFLGNPDEDRDIIPLVSISLDLSDVTEVNDPMDLLREIDEFERLVLEHRRRQARAEREHGRADAVSLDASWVVVAADDPSIFEHQNLTAPKRTRFSSSSATVQAVLHLLTYRTELCDAAKFKLQTGARHMRRRVVAFLKVTRAVLTCSFMVRIEYTLDLD